MPEAVAPVMIHVEKLIKEYSDLRRGKLVALSGIGFQALAGEIFGLLGPNGAGKTTALRIISTMLRPTSGLVTVNGFDVVTQPSEVRHQIGFVSANTGMYDRMTAWEMVDYFGQLYGIADEPRRERMELLFERLKMNEIRELLGAKMSTGMKQKVSIARALVHDPPVLIFDEATNGLDVLVARRCWTRSVSCASKASASCFPRTLCAKPRSCATGSRSFTEVTFSPPGRSQRSAKCTASTISRSYSFT